jgi:hypothetical protein
MLDVDRVVDEGLLAELLNTGHSRIPVYRNNNRWGKQQYASRYPTNSFASFKGTLIT